VAQKKGGEATHLFDRAPCRHCHTFPIHRGQRGRGVVDAGTGCSIVRRDLAMSWPTHMRAAGHKTCKAAMMPAWTSGSVLAERSGVSALP